jgi:Cu/Ag efflux protein CusF
MKLIPLWLPLVLALPTAALAQIPAPVAPGKPASAAPAASRPMASGQVLEIDRKEKRVLLKHGPIQHIGMDAMTMEFSVPDAKLLASVKPGDKVRFDAVWRNDDYEITRMDVVKPRGSKRPQSRLPQRRAR